MFVKNINEINLQRWLKEKISEIPKGHSILDAGAGELKCRKYCMHLEYTSQDFCQYDGRGDGSGLQEGKWETDGIDIVSDITSIPVGDESFDAVLCSEVFEHIPDPLQALSEFNRILRPGGTLILTAPFASLSHFSPYYYYTGFSKHWYEYHLSRFGFEIRELTANGDWFDFCLQEIIRLGNMERSYGKWSWPLGYILGALAAINFRIPSKRRPATDLACFGWCCLAEKRESG